MGKRIDNTLGNWRWWVVLPFAPLALCFIAAQWFFRGIHWVAGLPVRALDDTEHVFRIPLAWARKGEAK